LYDLAQKFVESVVAIAISRGCGMSYVTRALDDHLRKHDRNLTVMLVHTTLHSHGLLVRLAVRVSLVTVSVVALTYAKLTCSIFLRCVCSINPEYAQSPGPCWRRPYRL
jgi:hypothetical protein